VLKNDIALLKAQEADQVLLYGIRIIEGIVDWEVSDVAIVLVTDDDRDAVAVVVRQRPRLRHDQRWHHNAEDDQ
jgi:hypothetical protein